VQDKLRDLDLGAAQRIIDIDLEGFLNYVDTTGATICGKFPIMILLAAMSAASASGEKLKAHLADYSNSGDNSNDWQHCVSYAGIAVEEA